jgi:phosphatidylserine decarboxylase
MKTARNLSMSSRDKLLTSIQYLVPQHLLSRLVGLLAASKADAVKNTFIQKFAARYHVDMAEAAEPDLLAYESFNAFFTRALKPGVRPIDTTPGGIACPADGAISQLGPVQGERVYQAKGHDYTLTELLGGSAAHAALFENGVFATVYLSPRDYHRVHMPYGGTLREMIYVPGDLFSVNTRTAENVPRLFARNERVVALFDTDLGPMAVIMVGAMIVTSVETVWAGLVQPHGRHVLTTTYKPGEVVLEKGAEMGRFRLGSTAIVLFGKDMVDWESSYREGLPTRMGELMGRRRQH